MNCFLPGLAYRNNSVTQNKIAEENAIPTLVQLLVNQSEEEIQVEVAYTIGCIVLSNKETQAKLDEETQFSFDILTRLLGSESEVV